LVPPLPSCGMNEGDVLRANVLSRAELVLLLLDVHQFKRIPSHRLVRTPNQCLKFGSRENQNLSRPLFLDRRLIRIHIRWPMGEQPLGHRSLTKVTVDMLVGEGGFLVGRMSRLGRWTGAFG
jgi:hypothetical protein